MSAILTRCISEVCCLKQTKPSEPLTRWTPSLTSQVTPRFQAAELDRTPPFQLSLINNKTIALPTQQFQAQRSRNKLKNNTEVNCKHACLTSPQSCPHLVRSGPGDGQHDHPRRCMEIRHRWRSPRFRCLDSRYLGVVYVFLLSLPFIIPLAPFPFTSLPSSAHSPNRTTKPEGNRYGDMLMMLPQ